MGEVFAAYDPELDRRIALKLLASDVEGERLSAEARAMARLSHPNVVGIHDVSEVHGRPLIAMELVDGTTLAKWFETKPSVAEIVQAFVAAGRGLAAAHEAGIVHRDFKLANVLVEVDKATGKIKRVRVGDFGLAQARATRTPTSPAEDHDDALVGTPRYMSPEQFGDGTVTARSDQFSFCVALYEGVYGEVPFEGTTPAQLARAVLEGARRPAPERADVPRRVRAVLERGLSRDPTDRFESMDALLAELEPPTRRRSWMLTAALIGLAGIGGLAAAPDPVPPGCEPSAFAELSPDRRDRAREALELQGLSKEVWAELDATLDGLEGISSEARRDVCAAYEGGDISEDVLFSRLYCIDVTDAELSALVALWEEADAEAAAIAKRAIYSLGRSSCSQVHGNRMSYREMDAELMHSLMAGRATTLALQSSEKHREAIAAVDALRPEELAPGRITSDLFRLRGLARLDLGDLDSAEADLWQAVAIATEVEAHEAAALAWIWLIQLEAVARHRPKAALRWQQVAEAHVGSDPWLGALLQNHVGSAHFQVGDVDAAEQAFELALEYSKQLSVPITGHEALVLNNLGSIAARRRDYDKAERLWRESLERHQADSSIPTVTMSSPLLNLTRLHTLLGDEPRGAEARLETLEFARGLSASSPAVASETAGTTAELFEFVGQYHDAYRAAEEALTFLRGEPGADPGLIAARQLDLSTYSRMLPDQKLDNPPLEQALKVIDGGGEVADIIIARTLLAEIEWQLDHGDPSLARSYLERATSVIELGTAAIPFPVGRLLRARARLRASTAGPRAALDDLLSADIDPDVANTADRSSESDRKPSTRRGSVSTSCRSIPIVGG